MQVFNAEVEEHTEGWVRTRISDLGAHVGEWVLVDPHQNSWAPKEVTPHEGELLSVQYKEYKTGKYEDFMFNGTWIPVTLRVTVTGWGGKNEVRDIYPNDTAYVYSGDLDYPEPYRRVDTREYSHKGFSDLELTAAYWHAVALKDEQLADLLYRFSTGEEI